MTTLGFPGGSDGKESACNAGDMCSIPGLGRFSGEGNGNPLQYSCLENAHGQRSLADYSPWGHKESDTTETFISICVSAYLPHLKRKVMVMEDQEHHPCGYGSHLRLMTK